MPAEPWGETTWIGPRTMAPIPPPSNSSKATPPFPPDTTPEKTAQFIKDEFAKWAPIIREAVKIA